MTLDLHTLTLDWLRALPSGLGLGDARQLLQFSLLGLTAATMSFLLTPPVRALAFWLGAVDRPGGRKVHDTPVARLGGVAVLAAFLCSVSVGLMVDPTIVDAFLAAGCDLRWLYAGALLVATIGIADDVWRLGPVPKLCFQILAALTVLAGGYGIHAVTNPFTGAAVELGWLGVPVTLLWVVGITNAINLIDGLDGLATGVGIIASVTLAVVSLSLGRVEIALLAVALVGALAGFLCFNFHPARSFLGDSGSLAVGYLLSVFSIESSHKGATAVVMLVPMLALGLPIMDTLLAMLRRLLSALRVVRLDRERNEYRFLVVGSASIFRADRNHIHHRLMQLGLTHRRTVLLLYGVCGALGVVTLLAVQVQGGAKLALVAIVAVGTWLGVRRLGYREIQLLRRGTLLPLFELPVLGRRPFQALVDAVSFATAFVLSAWITRSHELGQGAWSGLLRDAVAVTALELAVFFYAGVYRRSFRNPDAGDLLALLKALLAAQGAAVAGVVLAGLVGGLPDSAASLYLLCFYLTATLVVGTRTSFNVLESIMEPTERNDAQPVLIYGAGNGGTVLLKEIHQNPSFNYEPVGFLDDRPALWGSQVNGVRVLGGSAHLGRILTERTVRGVIIATPRLGKDRIEALAATCQARGVDLRRFRMAVESLTAYSPGQPRR